MWMGLFKLDMKEAILNGYKCNKENRMRDVI